MAWESQTLKELILRVEQDFSAKFFGKSAALRRSVLKVLASIWAAIVYLLTLLLEWIYRNNFAHLCDEDQVPLHGIPIGIYQNSGAYAAGPVRATGDPGEAITQDTIVQDETGDLQYEVIDDYEIGPEGDVIIYIASLDGGSAYNQEAGTILQFESPTGNYDAEVEVQDGGIGGGDDVEDLEDTRDRVLFKKQNPPQGGADADWTIWATRQPNVTEAYILGGYPQANNVQVVCADYDKTENGNPPIVDDVDVQRVQDYISDPIRKPVTSAPVASSVVPSNIVVNAAIRPYSSANVSAAVREINSLFIRTGYPNQKIPDETVLATIARTYGIEAVEIDSLLQDGVETELIELGYQQVAWLLSYNFRELTF